jgi:iron complex transport system substrate-binding protein
MINIAGGQNIADSVVNASTGYINPEYLLSRNPDKIVIGRAHWIQYPNSLHLGYAAEPGEALNLFEGYTGREG